MFVILTVHHGHKPSESVTLSTQVRTYLYLHTDQMSREDRSTTYQPVVTRELVPLSSARGSS
jgi:hypothetical protein